MSAYYNEIDPFAAQWLRELIKQGHIAPGIVDERSIEDVRPDELSQYSQCHFFAGIGVWSYALRQAGWSDDRPVWTGSCPCQPFSSAGKGAGFDDERHLWPAFHWLIQQCRPGVVFGEQVAGKAGETWLDLVSTDLEGIGYTCGAAVTAACGFGAPHQRKRLYWVGHPNGELPRGDSRAGGPAQDEAPMREVSDMPRTSGAVGVLADSQSQPSGARSCDTRPEGDARERGNIHSNGSRPSVLADTSSQGLPIRQRQELPGAIRNKEGRAVEQRGSALDKGLPSPTNGHWRDVDWLGCRDGKWRPVEPGTCPLANGAPARVGRVRGYGNAIVAQQAQGFIEAFIEAAQD